MRRALVLVPLTLLGPRLASAQLTRLTSPVDQPGYSFTAPDGPEAMALNPSAIAHLESWGVGHVHAGDGDGRAMAGRGDGFYAATPILFGLVDHLGGFASALAAARRAPGVGPDIDFFVVPGRPLTLLDTVVGFLGVGASPWDPLATESQAGAIARVAPELRAILDAILSLRHAGAGAPMALAPGVIVPR